LINALSIIMEIIHKKNANNVINIAFLDMVLNKINDYNEKNNT